MAIMNLGMGSGFGVDRPDSQVVKSQQEYSNDYDSWLKQAQQRLDAARGGNSGLEAQLQLQNIAANAITQSLSGSGFSPGQIAPNVILQGAKDTGLGVGWDPATSAAINAALPNYIDSNQARYDAEVGQRNVAAAQDNLTNGQQQWQTQRDNYTNNQAASQQAYNQQNGIGYAGGILNSSYANPFGSTVTGSANPAAGATGASSFGTGLMGQGDQAATPSTGLAPTNPYTNPWSAPMGSTQQPQGAASWGGPFSAKNPWSLG